TRVLLLELHVGQRDLAGRRLRHGEHRKVVIGDARPLVGVIQAVEARRDRLARGGALRDGVERQDGAALAFDDPRVADEARALLGDDLKGADAAVQRLVERDLFVVIVDRLDGRHRRVDLRAGQLLAALLCGVGYNLRRGAVAAARPVALVADARPDDQLRGPLSFPGRQAGARVEDEAVAIKGEFLGRRRRAVRAGEGDLARLARVDRDLVLAHVRAVHLDLIIRAVELGGEVGLVGQQKG